MSWVESRTRTFQARTALPQYRRVRLTAANLVELCSDADLDCIGVAGEAALAADEYIPVILLNAQGTIPMVCVAVGVAVGDAVYAAADGKIDDSGTVLVGVALATGQGALSVVEVVRSPASILGSIARASLTQDDLALFPIKVKDLFVWDTPGSAPVIATAANDDLAVVYNTHLTLPPTIETGDVKTLTNHRDIGFQFVVPPEYVDGETINLRVNAGAKTTVAGTSLLLDAVVARQADPTVDICATAAQSINNLVAANKDFVLTPTNVVRGDVLDVVLSIAYVDAATGTAVIGKINKITMLLDIKG